MCVCVYVCMCVYVYVCMYVCVCMYGPNITYITLNSSDSEDSSDATVDDIASFEVAANETITNNTPSEGTDSSDIEGTDGSDTEGTDGSDTEGTDSSDTEGTDSSDTEGTDGSDTEGTDASGIDNAHEGMGDGGELGAGGGATGGNIADVVAVVNNDATEARGQASGANTLADDVDEPLCCVCMTINEAEPMCLLTLNENTASLVTPCYVL